MVSACPEAAAPVASDPPAEARSQRLAKFKREQVVVDTLNRGVSVAEIAARVGVGEKRMRAIIRDPRTGIRRLARRMPHPPEPPDPSPGVVAIQLSRLNEALLVAYSAMSPTNLKAVDQFVKIVRELDRYGGAFAAEWARPEASPRIIPESQPGDPGLDDVQESSTLGGALFCSAELGLQDDEAIRARPARCDRPENPAQSLEKVESSPGVSTLAAALPPGQSPGVGDAVDDRVDKPAGAGERPQNPAQHLEKAESAPGGATLVAALPPGQSPGVDDRVDKPAGADDRPQNPAQSLEKVESAPGIGLVSQTAEAAPADPISTPDLILSLLRSAPGRQVLRSRWSTLRAGTYGVASQHGGGDFPYPAPTGTGRPENLLQNPEIVGSAPGTEGLDAAGSGSLPSPLIPCPIRPGRFPMTFDGVGAC